MLHLHHVVGDPDLDAVFTQHELRERGLIVMRTVHSGGRNDDALEQVMTTEGWDWSGVRFVVDGPLLVRHGVGATVVSPGEAFASLRWRDAAARSLTDLSDVLAIVWRSPAPRVAGGHGRVTLSPAGRAGLVRLARTIAERDTESAVWAAREAIACLRAAGIVVNEVSRAPLPPADHAFARALERTFFPMTSRPMAVDLAGALGVGERQALRRANAFFRDYCASGSTWRDYVHVMRVGLGTFFVSHPQARTEHVSRLLGFASPTSFCHALHAAGLPSPQAIRRALLAA